MATGMRVKSMILLAVLSLIVVFALADRSFAGTIVGSKHDFSAANTSSTPFAGVWEVPGPGGFPLVIDQVCVFCHTPHGASKNVPGMTTPMWLWNRTNSPPAGYTYSMYSSGTFSNPTGQGGPTGVSMMCMSCHDGVTSIAVNTLLNPPGGGPVTANGITNNGAIGDIYNGSIFLGWGPNIGGAYPGQPGNTTIDLSNDHPISFDWPVVLPSGLRSAPTDTHLRLFGPSKNRVECATCHAVHDPSIVPFLAISNANSALCIACHNK